MDEQPGEIHETDSNAKDTTLRTFQCVNCHEDRFWGERIMQTFQFQNKLETFDVEVALCTKCFMSGGLSKIRQGEIVEELSDAQKGMRW